MKHTLIAGLLFALGVATPSPGAPTTFSQTHVVTGVHSWGSITTQVPVQVPKFDPALGTLVGMRVGIQGGSQWLVELDSVGPSRVVILQRSYTFLELSDLSSGLVLDSSGRNYLDNEAVGPPSQGDPICDFQGPGYTFTLSPADPEQGDGATDWTNPALLAAWTGTGTGTMISDDSKDILAYRTSGNGCAHTDHQDTFTVTVTYFYQ